MEVERLISLWNYLRNLLECTSKASLVVGVSAMVVAGIALGIYSWIAHSLRGSSVGRLSISNRYKPAVNLYQPAKDSIWKNKRVLVIVNPIGGQRNGEQIWNIIVQPMLKKSKIMATLFVTKRKNHARDLCASLKIDIEELKTANSTTIQDVDDTYRNEEYSAILCVSGDGMVHEILNGLASKANGGSNLRLVTKIFERFPISVIPGGTGNAVAASFGSSDPFEMTKRFIEGTVHSVDLAEAITEINVHVWDVNAFYFGLAGDHDALIEGPLRWMGPIRVAIAPLYVFCVRKQYQARITFCPIEVTPEDKKKFNYGDITELKSAEENSKWKVLDTRYIFFCAMNIPYAERTVNFAPGVKLCGGEVDLVLIHMMSRWECIKVFLNLSNGSSHIFHPCFKSYKASAFTLELQRNPDQKLGHLMASGEIIPATKITVNVHHGIARFVY